MDNQKREKESIWKAPQISVAIFVLISAYTTGQGMTDTFFDGSFICGVGISVGVQLLLVWLGWKLPKLFSMGNRTAKLFTIIAYTFTIVWSTGFSFVYVCNHIYSSIYMRDDQNLLEDVSRKNMADLKLWADEDFNQYLEIVTDGVKNLQLAASEIDDVTGMDGAVPDYTPLKEYFADNAEVLGVVKKCENMFFGKSPGNPEKLHGVLDEAGEGLQTEMDGLQDVLEGLGQELITAEDRITELSEKKYRFKSGTTADLELEILINGEKIKKQGLMSEIKLKEAEKQKIEDILRLVKSLDSHISAREGSVEGVITIKFARILAELGAVSPDMEMVNALSDEIFEALATALQADGSNTAYAGLFNDYLSLKESLKTLENIRAVQTFCFEEDSAAHALETDKLVSSSPTKEEKSVWNQLWNDKFAEIKANYYKLSPASQQALDKNYKQISRLQRCVLTELNGIERAKYYLFSSHAFLAWLSLALALFLDMVPVLLMVIKEQVSKTAVEGMVYKETELAPNL